MKHSLLSCLCVGTAVMLLAAGCGRREKQVDATQALQQSFKAAEPQVRQAIQTVNGHLQAKDYVAAARTLAPVVTQQPLTEPEKRAVGVALEQINQGIAADRSLNTKEMYELRARMFQAVHRNGSRF